MTTLEVLEAGRALIADPAGWTKGPLARDANGNPTVPEDPAAKCFCSLGAARRAAFDGGDHPMWGSALEWLPNGLAAWNDAEARTHAEVLTAWDRAIAHCRAEVSS